MRYSPPFIRSNLPQLIRDAFALKQTVEPSDGRLPEAAAADSGGWLEESLLPLLPSIVFSLPYLALIIVLLSDLRRCRSANIKLRPLKPTQLLYQEYFGIEGKLYGFKVAMLQLFTVMLQAFGKLQIMGGLVSFAFHSAPKHSDAFERCFWTFMGFLCLNSIYPSVLLAVPSVKWVRRGAAMMDAVLDIAYTSTYLIITLLAIYDCRWTKSFEEISGMRLRSTSKQNWTRHLRSQPTFLFLCCLLFTCTCLHCLPCLRAKQSIDLLEEVATLTELYFPVAAEPIEIFLLKEISDVLQSLAFLLLWFRYVSFYVVSAIFNPSWFRNLLDLLTQFVM